MTSKQKDSISICKECGNPLHAVCPKCYCPTSDSLPKAVATIASHLREAQYRNYLNTKLQVLIDSLIFLGNVLHAVSVVYKPKKGGEDA